MGTSPPFPNSGASAKQKEKLGTGYGVGYCSLSQRDKPGLRNGEIPGFEVCPDVIFSSLSIFNIPNIPTTRLGQNL